jgi:hypothetical protein
MTIVPNFLLKKMYRAGSLRSTENGVSFEMINCLGPGQLSGINGVTLNELSFSAEKITFKQGDTLLPAKDITEDNPASFFLNQITTVLIETAPLPTGEYTLKLDVVSREAGRVTLTVKDKLS